MDASILDLRYKSRMILDALERRERVNILYHGKTKGVILPPGDPTSHRLKEHPFFGMRSKETTPVSRVMRRLRDPRYS